MRTALLVVLALLFATEAWATTYNVTNDTNLGTSMAAAVGGDIINIAAGSYTGSFVPSNSGSSGSYIRIVGSQANPATVNTTQGLTWAEGTARSYISWTGIKVSDDVNWWRANYCSLTYARADSGGLKLRRTNSDITSAGASQGNVISDCTFTQNVGGDYVVHFQGAYENTILRCRFYGTTTAATFDGMRGRYLFRSSSNTFTDCSMSIEAWGATNGEQQAQGIRDSSRFNVFTRDTMLLGLTSKGARRALLSQSGTWPGTTGYNSWVNCYYKSFATNDGSSVCAFEFQDNTNGGLVQGCQFISRVSTAIGWTGSGLPDSMVVRHNTFYTGGYQAFKYSPDANCTTARFNGNAYVSRTATSCGTDQNNYHLQTLGAFGQSDSNSFFMADSSVAFGKRNGGASEVCYTPAAWRTATSNDLASRSFVLGGSVVTDTTWATLDLRPASVSSSLVSALFPSGYAGAFNYESGTTPPAVPPPPPAASPRVVDFGWGGSDGFFVQPERRRLP